MAVESLGPGKARELWGAPPAGSPGTAAPGQLLRGRWLLAGSVAVVGAVALVALLIGPTPVSAPGALAEVLDRLTGLHVRTGLSASEAAVVWEIRAPRVVLGLLVGGALALAGGSYQGVFRNPLADPYLLGVAAGAGLGATIAITSGAEGSLGPLPWVPLAAFSGALLAVSLTYAVAARGGERSPATLLLGGVAIASTFTAAQTYLQLRQTQTLRDVYTWILGDLSTAGWHDVVVLLPYVVLSSALLLAYRRRLDVLAVGDEEAATMGVGVARARLVVLAAASLMTAAAVSVSGLIGFVGIIVPHAVRLIARTTSYRVVLPLSLAGGGAFLVLADLVARTALSPAELPIGVVTAALGGPFFIVVLRKRGPRW